MKTLFEIDSKNENDTSVFAGEMAKILTGGDIVALNGDLGSGKTFFVKCLCKIYNINLVTSPTFAIVNEYIGLQKVFHFDFYRINKLNELFDVGFQDYLNDESAIIFIEWADLFKELLPKTYYEVKFAIVEDNLRRITVIKHE